jgi:hypothetical protein
MAPKPIVHTHKLREEENFYKLCGQDGQVPAAARPERPHPAAPARGRAHGRGATVWLGAPPAGVGGGGARHGARAPRRAGEPTARHRPRRGGAVRRPYGAAGQTKPALSTEGTDSAEGSSPECTHPIIIMYRSCSVADPDPGSGAFLTSGWVKNQDPDPG